MAIRGGMGGRPGGGGRSHFSSSSSSGGRSHYSSSRSSSSSYHRPIGGGYHHRGGVHVGYHFHMPLTAKSALIFFGIFFAVITFMLIIGINAVSSNIDIIKLDYDSYQSLIEMAMENDDYVRYATITGKYPSTKNRYYLEYTLHEGPGYEYDTFAIYTKEEVDQFKVGDTIKIAVEDKVVNMFTATIPFDYYNSDITKDAEYMSQSSTRTILIFIAIGTGVASIALIVLGIKKKKKEQEEPLGSSTLAETSSTPKSCKYCGTRLSSSDSKCPGCGAKIE